MLQFVFVASIFQGNSLVDGFYLYISLIRWCVLQYIECVLSTFTSFKLEEQRIDRNASKSSADAMDAENEHEIRESLHFFAKFLTNPKLLALQLSDSNFRRSVLVQCLILFQYLRSSVKFKAYES